MSSVLVSNPWTRAMHQDNEETECFYPYHATCGYIWEKRISGRIEAACESPHALLTDSSGRGSGLVELNSE